MGNLYKHTGTITGFLVTAHGSAVFEVTEDLYTLLDYLMGSLTIDTGNKTDTAGIVFFGGVVKTSFFKH
jgi:hypothetical protein